KAWVARFGGSGVRIGVRLSHSAFDAAELFDETPEVAPPRPIESAARPEPEPNPEPEVAVAAEPAAAFDAPARRAPRAASPSAPPAPARGHGIGFVLWLFAALLAMAGLWLK